MDWVFLLIVIVIIISIGFNILGDLFEFFAKVIAWIIGPKQWWSGTLARGSFRPRVRTVLYMFLLILLLLVSLAIAFVLFIGSGWDFLGWLFVLGLIFLPLTIKKIWSWLRENEQVTVQHQRDNAVLELSNSAPSCGVSTQEYCLYLRPFTTTGQLPICVLASTLYLKNPVVEGPTQVEKDNKFVDLETLIAMAVSSHAPLVALGRPGEQVGAGRLLTTEESWQSEFTRLSASAKIIFILPSSKSGTKWELRNIFENESLLSKTIFVIPPNVGPSDAYDDAIRTFELESGSDRLSLVEDLLKGEGIANEGSLFCFTQDGAALSFSSPLITYANPSPWRFLIDLWISRETIVFARSRFRKCILKAIDVITVRESNTWRER